MQKKTMKNIISIIGLLVMASTVLAEDFQVGQTWAYETRENEKGSTLTVVKIDEINKDIIIHISISGLSIKNPDAPSGYTSNMSHAPIAVESLASSVTKLVGTVDVSPDFQEGYDIWREAFDSGDGGVFTISVAECVEFMEQAINQ